MECSVKENAPVETATAAPAQSLIAYAIDGSAFDIRPAPHERPWMDATPGRYAYRCLPLNIANAHGWEILCPNGFAVGWTGGPGLDAVVIQPDGGGPAPAISHFGQGIFTFHVNALMRTSPGYDIWCGGPINRPKDGVYPLTGVIETDWAPFTFTMNWIFTRPGIMTRFEKGEPFCHIFPIERGSLERINPRRIPLEANLELKAQYEAWSASRNGFNADLKKDGSKAQADGWQKDYYQGKGVEGQKQGPDDHRTRVRLKPFREF